MDTAVSCFVPSAPSPWQGGALHSGAHVRGPASARQPVRMAKSGKKKASQKAKRARVPDNATPTAMPTAASTPAAAPPLAARAETPDTDAADREALRQDVAAFKARNQLADDSVPIVSDTYRLAKTVFDNLLLADFFLVVGLLGWLVVALVPHFAMKNDALLDPWLGLWQPFIQPVLGVLMLATIGQGMLTYMFNSSD